MTKKPNSSFATEEAKLRTSGILLHVSSLWGRYGIGSLGKSAYDFVDFLKNSGQTYWQILPLCPTSFGDSPYQSPCVFAGNPYFIDLELLYKDGYLTEDELKAVETEESDSVDYAKVYLSRREIFKNVLPHFKENTPSDFSEFCKNEAYWLNDYSLFMAIKDRHQLCHLKNFPTELKERQSTALEKFEKENQDSVLMYKMTQYFFFNQWHKLKKYANDSGIKIIGDEPIYVSYDSSDVWAHPKNFSVDEDCNLLFAAGCPPDSFSPKGQIWGNPVYNFQFMKEDGYSWYLQRFSHSLSMYDVLRLDHFRAFDAYYKINPPFDRAENGEWEKGPGIAFFDFIKERLGNLNIIAEDLGFLTDEVRTLLKKTGFPGMKILQFAFDGGTDNDYLPHNYPFNCVVYTGTHDNDTVLGWEKTADKKDVAFAERYLRSQGNLADAMMLAALSSTADTAILTMQDLLYLGSESRMNTPSTLGSNWKWRLKKEELSKELSKKLYDRTKLYFRVNDTNYHLEPLKSY